MENQAPSSTIATATTHLGNAAGLTITQKVIEGAGHGIITVGAKSAELVWTFATNLAAPLIWWGLKNTVVLSATAAQAVVIGTYNQGARLFQRAEKQPEPPPTQEKSVEMHST